VIALDYSPVKNVTLADFKLARADRERHDVGLHLWRRSPRLENAGSLG